MINDNVKAAENNIARMINNIANQVESDTGMSVRSISVNRSFDKDKSFKVDIALEVKK